MDPSARWTLLYLEGVLADPDGNTDEARTKALEDLAWWASLQYEGKLTLRPEGDLRGHLKVAHEHLCSAQARCVIVASRHQLQAALDRISYVAAREGIEPGDTFSPLADLHQDVLDQLLTGHMLMAERELCDRVAEALRLTAEWSMAIALPGWSWFDALTEYRAERGWDVLPATGLPAGVTEAEHAEPVWSLTRIRETLDDPFTEEPTRAKAMRMLRWHEQRELAVPEAAAAEECAVARDLPPLGDEAGPVRGVPFLLEQLSTLAAESVYLWFNPRPGFVSWYVWTGTPAGTGGGEWGEGATAQEALADAFRRITSAIFDGRVVR